MAFPHAVRKAFPRSRHAALRAHLLTLARDGGDIRPAAQAHALTDAERITFGMLVQWLEKARTSRFHTQGDPHGTHVQP